MKVYKKITLLVLSFFMIYSCERYEDYIFDFIPTVYFGAQKPLRTVVARDDDMQFKMGVVLAGMRENNNEEWVSYVIDPELLADTAIVGDNVFQLMPEEYYTLSNYDEFIIPPGHILGEVIVNINHDLFTADPDAINNTYAFPIRITDTSVDRILNGENETEIKDYTIIVVKYISQYSGYYYRRGVQYELDEAGNHIDTIFYTDVSMNKSDVWYLDTQNAHIVDTRTTTSIAPTSPRNFLRIQIDENKLVDIESVEEGVAISVNDASLNTDEMIYYFDYVLEREGISYHLMDTLVQRQDPELDLRFEQW